MLKESYIKELLDACLEDTFDSYEFAQKTFLGAPWVYIRAWHNKKAVLFDISECRLDMYGISADAVKKEWCRAWGEW